ncbi:DNA adenine methylase [Achromobacter xylosoxidans]|uniref:DNA adenine methylase n=1 Tax=Alcaligenes xylosoxydans xylosoxydans TaxID=85698 RepID=UPI0022B8B871|nr:DNA adenine methylase [Achromobacter xylosoxidans]MCZ8383271.1 DNA adenine methylase [Achromobacter xylosoxidans]
MSTYVSGVLEENLLAGCTFYEPYAGGASVSLDLLRMGFIDKAVLVERDPLVFAFWHSVFNMTEALCGAIEACPVTLDTWHILQPTKAVDDPATSSYSLLQLGLAGLFFNRTNFSGIIGAGPIGGQKQTSAYKINCRFNKTALIRQIRAAAALAPRISVFFDDAVTFLRKNSTKIATGFSFVYIDPPYYTQGRKLYRHHYGDADHAKLAGYITSQGYPWLVSYDDHPRIRELYASQKMQPIYLDYRVKSSRTAQELVISNLVIPPPVYAGSPDLALAVAQIA